MKTLIESAIPELLRKAKLQIHNNDKCEVETFVNNNKYEDGFEVSLTVEYNVEHGDPSPEGHPDSVEVYSISMKVNDYVINAEEYFTESDFAY